jgi:hypothetical protein
MAELGAGGQDLARVIDPLHLLTISNQAKAAMPILTQGPDPNPKMPSLRCPPGACDSHIHLFGPAAKYLRSLCKSNRLKPQKNAFTRTCEASSLYSALCISLCGEAP